MMEKHYVTSDIHGHARRFYRLLDKMAPDKDDHLYILGDVIDRGPDGIRLLREIMDMIKAPSAPHIHLLLGNHEDMLLKCFGNWWLPDLETRNWKQFQNWRWNGGEPTIRAFQKLYPEEQQEIIAFLQQLPDHLTVRVEDQNYYLVHGWPGNTKNERVWGRPESQTQVNPMTDSRLIIGHTPVFLLDYTYANQSVHFRKLMEDNSHLKIMHTPGFIDIDCGCGHDIRVERLAALRLEDMREYYV